MIKLFLDHNITPYIYTGNGPVVSRVLSAGLLALLVDLAKPVVATTCAPTDSAEALKLAPADPRSSSWLISKWLLDEFYKSVQVA